ncbi:MAG: aminotransferase class III-fold pyridoxal phosphate-dependent enzyme [Microbacterium chocolatum]|nr:aminotransferase class III-fold pyridoxal phosphate-dependent enzyme [Microbacterium chocolatum]
MAASLRTARRPRRPRHRRCRCGGVRIDGRRTAVTDTTPASAAPFDYFAHVELPTPSLGDDEVRRLFAQTFGVEIDLRSLGSQQDQNFRVFARGSDEPLGVLKISNPAFSEAEIDLQDRAAARVADHDPTLRVPRLVAGPRGPMSAWWDSSSGRVHARVLENISGSTLMGSGYLSPAVVARLGDLAARVSVALDGFTHPATTRVLQWDARHALRVIDALLPGETDEAVRDALWTATADAAAALTPLAERLPVQAGHFDITDDNVLRAAPGSLPDAVIDFGDVTASWRVGEIATTVSSVLHHDGADALSILPALRAFHARRPLTSDEIAAVWPLVVLRGVVLVLSGRAQVRIDEANDYAASALDREYRIFETATAVPIPVMTAAIRTALEDVPEYGEKIAATLPDELDTVFFVNSGSEAVDLALRLAMAATGRRDIVAMREAYHGWTFASDAVSTSIADNPFALETRPDWVHTVAAANSYRGAHRDADAARYAPEAVADIDRIVAGGALPAGFVCETYFGNAGGVALPAGYLQEVYAAVRRHGGLAIADEVQVGFGRLGRWFWGFQEQGVVPDIVAVAKSIGAGHPLGAVITRREIADRYRTQGYFFSSTGGSPVSAAIGSAVLDVIQQEGLQDNARDVGAHLAARLEDLGTRHPIIGRVHGSGLYLGVEFVRDRETREPATAETAAICDRLLELGVIMQPTGDHQNVLKIKPPLCVTKESVDYFADALARTLETGW